MIERCLWINLVYSDITVVRNTLGAAFTLLHLHNFHNVHKLSRCMRLTSIKNWNTAMRLSGTPCSEASCFSSMMIASISSLSNSPGTSPEFRMQLISSRNTSYNNNKNSDSNSNSNSDGNGDGDIESNSNSNIIIIIIIISIVIVVVIVI